MKNGYVCSAHEAKPVKGYRSCAGCEVEDLRREVKELKARLLAHGKAAARWNQIKSHLFTNDAGQVEIDCKFYVPNHECERLTGETLEGSIDASLQEKADHDQQ